MAAAIDRVVHDATLRSVLAQAASDRVTTFALPRVSDAFRHGHRGSLRGVSRCR